CEASVAEAQINGEKVILARPLTYMNNSGRAVKQLMAKYKVDESNLIVIYDDYDLPKGKVRIRAGGSAGTHNGMRSIIGETGLKDCPRIRIGIRDEEVNIPIIKYELSEVRKDDYPLFADACHKAGDAAAEFARGLDIEKVMCKYN
ncbi:MAG: aminoacyl-tRNA hydrolase, partial [Clostridia bacterium]|nr:aminoacyl-tRNA hydrolase [Clostridia bacterium]